MREKYECEFCGDKFTIKKEYLNHLEFELSMSHEEAINAEDDALQIEEEIENLKKQGGGKR